MTEKQKQRVQDKITAIRKALADEKRRFGGYHDGRGLRYMPPALYLKIQDYAGAMTYFRWFDKNFPDDICMPDFLFEWTVALFKKSKLKEAEQKALRTFCSNTYLFDKFFNLEIAPMDKEESISFERPDYLMYFHYSDRQPELQDFAEWLAKFLSTEKFKALEQEFISIQQQLLSEKPGPERNRLLDRARKIESGQ